MENETTSKPSDGSTPLSTASSGLDMSKLKLNSDAESGGGSVNEKSGSHEIVNERTEVDSDVFEEALDEEEFAKKLLEQAEGEKLKGNSLYKTNDYEGALACYKNALEIVSSSTDASAVNSDELRSILYSNSAACYLKLENYENVVKECSSSIELKDSIKARMRRANGYEKLDRYEDALSDLKRVCEIDPRNREATAELLRLQEVVNQRREEMMGKLKNLGNSILGRFGLSIDNFKAVQDPNTGGYSISFQK